MRGPRWTAALAALLLTVGCAQPPPPEFDLVLRGGTVVDGSGAAPRRADVGIREGRVAFVGGLLSRTAAREIDATGRIVAPGFVDLHSHADLVLLADDEQRHALLAAKIRQGITTLIVGNCGLGVAPADAKTAAILASVNGWMTPRGVTAGPWDVGAYLDHLAARGVPLNVGTLAPHGPIRISAMGLTPGPANPDQMATMRVEAGRALDAGAFGLSTGLIYPPGMFTPTDELVELAEEVAARDRLFTAHVRGSSETLLEATRELVEIGRRSGARMHHSHMEAVGEPFWSRIPAMLAIEDAARAEGLSISHDVFPYTRAATMMSAIFPPWSLDGGIDALLERLADPPTRRRIAEEIETVRPEWPTWREGGWPHNLVAAVGWDGIVVSSVGPDGPSDWVGRSLADLAEQEQRPAFDVVADLMLSQRGQVGQQVDEVSGRGENLAPLMAILRHPEATIISDAEDYGHGSPHPAHAGSFARALRLNREHGLMPLEEMVRRMSSAPAERIGLEQRGKLVRGAAADLVVFDPETIADRATWDQPRLPAAGVSLVVINGVVVFEDGSFHGRDAGQVLRARVSPPVPPEAGPPS